MSEPFTLENAFGDTLHGLVDLPDEPGQQPAVVICHGFKGFMEWGFFPYLAELLARRGFVAVRFNFSGSGMRPGEDQVSDLEGFRANTYSRELADLESVLDALSGEDPRLAAGRVDRSRIGLLGHSRGGGTTLLGAAGRFSGRVRALVTWAAVADYDRFSEEDKAHWRRQGELAVLNVRTGQELPLGVGLLDDLEANREALDLTAAASRRAAPWLVVHGQEDESVPWVEAQRLFAAAEGSPGERELLVIPGAGHTFGARHPFAGPTPDLVEAMNATQIWFRRYLG